MLLVAHRGKMLLRTNGEQGNTRMHVSWRTGLLIANPLNLTFAPAVDRGVHEAVAIAIPLGPADAPLLVGTALARGRDGLLPLSPHSMIVGSTEPFVAQVLAGPHPAGSMLGVQMELLLQQIMRTLIVEATTDAANGVEGVYARALAVIAQRYSEPDVTSDVVAAEVGVSRRGLERAFRAQGDTIGRAIRRERLEASERLLHYGPKPRPTVAQVASLVGYASGASLARAMAIDGRPAPRAPRV
ncbi:MULTISPECIES: helix-turn-helix domain-containing protein [unclassified Microbacterium]|uniref:AraC family transcriptional regulator n=1 Tax=unclassified Microbacterium TaxID=2609290 RepID=UPI00364CC0ED